MTYNVCWWDVKLAHSSYTLSSYMKVIRSRPLKSEVTTVQENNFIEPPIYSAELWPVTVSAALMKRLDAANHTRQWRTV